VVHGSVCRTPIAPLTASRGSVKQLDLASFAGQALATATTSGRALYSAGVETRGNAPPGSEVDQRMAQRVDRATSAS